MPTLAWLKREFNYGYDSGNVLSRIPNLRRWREQKVCGGSYRRVFLEAVLPYLRPDANVLELGPGRGSWSRAILQHLPRGQLQTVDFQDVSRWLTPAKWSGRLICHQVDDNSLRGTPDQHFDLFWSFGVLCHNNNDAILEILTSALPKMKPGGYAVHQFGDWKKLDAFGWERGHIPVEFKQKPDDEIWWPRNDQDKMRRVANAAGWHVVSLDLGLLQRDAIMVLQAPL